MTADRQRPQQARGAAVRAWRASHRALVMAAVLAAPCGPAWAQTLPTTTAEPAYLHTTVRGDTLIGLGHRFLQQPEQWPELARLNGVTKPNRITVGLVLRIPLRLMAVESAPAEVIAVSGDVRAGAPGAIATPVAVGQAVPEGSELSTGAGNVTVQLVDGTVLRLRAASRLQIDESNRVPRAGVAGVVRSGVQLQRGQVEVQAQPAAAGQPGFRVSTPQGVLGVRGTEFRVNTADQTGATRGEVLEGAVAARGTAAAPTEQVVPAGFGVVVDSSGRVAPPVPLLQGTDLAQLPTLQERALVRFSLAAVAGATAYRGQVARDASFDQLLTEVRSDSTELRIADLPDGNYVLRVQAVDANGLHGKNADHRFRLKARPEPPLPQSPAPRAVITGDRVDLAWTVNPDARSYRLQLSSSEDFSKPLRDLPGQNNATLPLEGLAPGTYYWRLASERSATDQGPFGIVNQFELRLLPPPPKAPGAAQVGVDDGGVRLAWEGLPSQTFEVQVARDMAFATALLQYSVQTPSLALQLPASGRYYVRVRAREADGFVGPYSTPQQIDLPHCLRLASGACVKAEGAPVLTVP